MASVGKSVQKAIDEYALGDSEIAILHACNALDGTARKIYPNLGSNARFTKLLRENYEIFGPMGQPGIDLINTRWPVRVSRPQTQDKKPDIADIIYSIHRCSHGHGDELPEGFTLLADAHRNDGETYLEASRGKLQLSDRIIFGILAVAICADVNRGQTVPEGYVLTWRNNILPINQWWGEAEAFKAMTREFHIPLLTLDFSYWPTP